MIKITFKKQLLLLVCCVIAFGCITSCTKDSNTASTKVELLSFGPSGAQHGDTISFIGKNLNKVTSIVMIGDSVVAANFITQTPELIKIIIPQKVEEGTVILRTTEGNLISKTLLDFTVTVSVTSITPTARPGDNITITGNYVNWITSVIFAKGVVTKTFVSKSLTQLVVKVPQNAQSGVLSYTTGGFVPLSIDNDIHSNLTVTLPAITAISPNPVARGSNLTITGTNLDLVSAVLFKGFATPVTSFVSKTATQIVVTVPATTNKGTITIQVPSGLNVDSPDVLKYVGDLPDLAPLAYALYEDNLVGNWQDWGWSRTADYTNTDNVRDGTASMKLTYTGAWGAVNFRNSSVSMATYNEFAFSIFGTPGTDGKIIHIQQSGATDVPVTIQEGKWVEFKITKAQLGNPATIDNLVFKCETWTGTVYVDHVGLR